MNMLIKRKEIAAAALVVLIGCAGYLNWSYRDTVRVRDGESYIETGRRLGEAQLVSSETENVEDDAEETLGKTDEQKPAETEEEPQAVDAEYFDEARYERDEARSKTMEILDQTCSNQSFDEETRRKAGERLIGVTQSMEQEQEIESIAQSKGYPDTCVYVHDSNVTITVRKNGFNSEDALKLTEIAQEQTGIESNDIRIVNVDK